MTALKAPCQHGRYDEHQIRAGAGILTEEWCPGGSLLPPDSLRYWFCIPYQEIDTKLQERCDPFGSEDGENHADCGWHWLIPTGEAL